MIAEPQKLWVSMCGPHAGAKLDAELDTKLVAEVNSKVNAKQTPERGVRSINGEILCFRRDGPLH